MSDKAVAKAGYKPSPAVAKLLAERGVKMHPPKSKAGSHDVEWEGKKFVLPAEPGELSLRRAAEVLAQKAVEEDKLIAVSEIVDALPWDGAQAFARAVEDLFGFGLMEDRPGMFGPMPPVLRSIKTGPGVEDVIQVIWGGIGLPQITGKDQDTVVLQCGMGVVDGERPVFQVNGKMPRGKRHILDTLMALARIYAAERSIYKGKAIRMFVDEDGALDWDKEPEFLRLNGALKSELVFSAETAEQIDTSLFTPIRHADACRKLGIPLKRGILLEGPYGVGKSMTAAATANLAVENGWTFIMLNRVGGLQQILDFAHRYAPVVVFAEDIDRVIAGHDRTVSIDDILNTLDGVHGKDREIITVLTTNHVDKINQAMLRPGRLDAIVSIRLPDAAAAERLVRLYARGLVKAETPLPSAREALAGKIPAVIREAVERAKLAAIARTDGASVELTDADLVVAATSMETQLKLLAPSTPEMSMEERLGQALRDTVAAGLANGPVAKVHEDTQAIRDHIGI
jgi:transitional endoplasmic reticulum ATPase